MSTRTPMPSVITNDGIWIGQFMSEADAATWIKERVKPAMFSVVDKRPEGAPAVRGIYVKASFMKKATKKTLAAMDLETGFIANTLGDKPLGIEPGSITHTGAVPERSSKRARGYNAKTGSVPKITKRTRRVASEDDVMAAAVAASLAEDGQDDTARTDAEELSL
jgi:hypothetical protein